MEFSEMSEVSTVTEDPGTHVATGQDDDERRRTTILVVCCLLMLLLILLVLMCLGLLVEDSGEETGDKNEEPTQTYATGGHSHPVKSSMDALVTTSPQPAATMTEAMTKTTSTRGNTTTTTTTTTTTEDTWNIHQNYSQGVFHDRVLYLCAFWSEKQGFVSHGRTYGIGYFPYPFCEVAMYCCYNLTSQMELEPGRPDVDLPPRDAVRRMTSFKSENKQLLVWLVVTGSDLVFTKLLQEATAQATFRRKTLEWMKQHTYDGIRMWWPEAPPPLNGSLATFFNDTNGEYLQHNRSFGYLVPNGDRYHDAYNTTKLAELDARVTLVMYPIYPRNLTFIERHSAGRKTAAGPYTIQEMRTYWYKQHTNPQILNSNLRKAMCHLMPLLGVTYKINPADCNKSMSDAQIRRIRPVDHGPAGPLTKTKGILSLPEVCDKVDSSWVQKDLQNTDFSRTDIDSYHFACKGDEAIAYPTGSTADDTVRKLTESTIHDCYGVMNPEYDDFAGACKDPVKFGETIYPIVRTIFQCVGC